MSNRWCIRNASVPGTFQLISTATAPASRVLIKTAGTAAKTAKRNRRQGRRISNAAPQKRRANTAATQTCVRFRATLVNIITPGSPRTILLTRLIATQPSITPMAWRR